MIKSNGTKSSLVSNYRRLSIDFQLKCWLCSAMRLAHKGIFNPIKLEQSCCSVHYSENSDNPLGSEQENHFNHKYESGVICQSLLPCPIIWIWAICVHTVKDIVTRFTETDRWVSSSEGSKGFIKALLLLLFLSMYGLSFIATYCRKQYSATPEVSWLMLLKSENRFRSSKKMLKVDDMCTSLITQMHCCINKSIKLIYTILCKSLQLPCSLFFSKVKFIGK